MEGVANMSVDIGAAVSRPVSVNLYVTPPGKGTSLVPHSDFQCSLMVQLHGRKRWRLWKVDMAWLPVRYRHVYGRDEGDALDFDRLGPPLLDVTLDAGDVLYVPRGCIHHTSTPVADDPTSADTNPSMHLTVGMEALWDTGISNTWEAMLIGGQFFRHEHHLESYYTALGNLVDKDLRFRKSIPPELMQSRDKGVWGEHIRTMLHAIVDEMVDNTELPSRLSNLMHGMKAHHERDLLQTARRVREEL